MTCRRLDVDDVVRDEVSDASQTFVVPSEAPETDVQPHINIGPNRQASLPILLTGRVAELSRQSEEEKATLLWSPECLSRSVSAQESMCPA